MEVRVGQKATYERAFSTSDIESFGELSGDKGAHHKDRHGAPQPTGFTRKTALFRVQLVC